jgi:hypothetical protein
MSIPKPRPEDKDSDWEQEKLLWEAEKKGNLSSEAVSIDEFLDLIPGLHETRSLIRKQGE